MLVIDLVELGVAQHGGQGNGLHAEHATVADQLGDALGDAMQFFEVKENARRRDQLGAAFGGNDFMGHFDVEEARPRFDPALVGHFRQVARAVHAEGAEAVFLVAGQPGAVVAADVHDQVVGLEAEPCDEAVGAVLEMGAQGLGSAGDIEVFTKHRFLGHGVVDLHGGAVVAKADLQRVIRFAVRQIFRP